MLAFEKIVNRSLRLIAFVMFVIMIVVVFAQVMLRYFLGSPLAWSDELARLLFIWVSFLGVTLIHYSPAGHPAVTFLVDKLPLKNRALLEVLLNIIMVICFIAVFKAGMQYTMANYRFISPVLHYSNSVKYAVIPFSMALMAIKSFERIIENLKKLLKKS